MNEVQLKQKLDTIVKLAQTRILTFLGDFTNTDTITKVNEVFKQYPIVLDEVEKEVNVFGKVTQAGGLATKENIVIPKDAVRGVSLDKEYELDRMLGTIIHEYAHQFRKINSQYGNMLEESFATIFAETCVNYSKKKTLKTTLILKCFICLHQLNIEEQNLKLEG